MSERDDEESAKNLWDELEEFAEDDPSDAEEFVEPESNDAEEFVEAEPVEADATAEIVSDPEPSDDPDTFGDDESAAVDDQVPNTEDAPDADEVFDEMDVSGVDGEALWDELAGTEAEAGSFEGEEADTEISEAAASDASEAAASDASEAAESIGTETAEPVGTEPVESPGSAATAGRSSGEGNTETLVDKRAYCQQCPFFSEPPTVSCGHAGTEIIEVLKDGRFRVQDCPVVTDTGPDRTILNDGP